MQIHCKAERAVKTLAWAFTAGAIVGGGVVGYAVDASAGPVNRPAVMVTQPGRLVTEHGAPPR
jgi:hypothetical protein